MWLFSRSIDKHGFSLCIVATSKRCCIIRGCYSACMWCNCKDSHREYIWKITDSLINEIRYVLEVEQQFKSAEKYTILLLFSMACISVYTATACNFYISLNFSNIVSTLTPKLGKKHWLFTEKWYDESENWSLHVLEKAFVCKLLDIMRKQKQCFN